jgi:hypothetical protein
MDVSQCVAHDAEIRKVVPIHQTHVDKLASASKCDGWPRTNVH